MFLPEGKKFNVMKLITTIWIGIVFLPSKQAVKKKKKEPRMAEMTGHLLAPGRGGGASGSPDPECR